MVGILWMLPDFTSKIGHRSNLQLSFTLSVCVLALHRILMLTSPQSGQYVQLDVFTLNEADVAMYTELGRLDRAHTNSLLSA